MQLRLESEIYIKFVTDFPLAHCKFEQVLERIGRMKALTTLACLVLLLTMAGNVLAEGRTDILVLELTDEQVSIIVHNCPRDETVTIDLTDDQISIIVHNFPRVEIRELTLGSIHLREDNTVELIREGDISVVPLSRSE